ncbi:MAG: sulfatase-like hydrolase/transferase [Myxococcota bacterium]|nr:sulfatase-like hydrolase/transferase [Myxococcota bacterium]
MKSRLTVVAVAAAVGVALVLSAAGVFYQKDAQSFFYPSKIAWRQQVLEGHLPIWQPLDDLGVPFAADPSQSALYPLNVLTLLPVPFGINLMIWLHLTLAWFGAFLLSRALGLLPPSAIAAATSFGLSGYVCSMTWNCTYLLGLSYMPLLGFAALRCARSPSRSRMAALGIICGLQFLTGEPQSAILSWLLAIGLVVFDPHPGILSVGRRVGLLSVGLGLGLATALPLILPALSFLSLTTRSAGIPQSEAALWSLDPRRLAELFCAWIHGDAARRDLYLGLFFDSGNNRLSPWAASLYLGSIPLLLSAFSFRKALANVLAWQWAVAALGLLSLGIAFGSHTPLFGWIHQYIPGASLFRYPVKWFALVTLVLGLLAGKGLDRWLASPSRSFPLSLMGMGLFLLIASLAASRLGSELSTHRPIVTETTAELIAQTALRLEGVVLIVAGLVLFGFMGRRPKVLGLCAVLLIACQLLFFNARILALGPSGLFSETPPLVKAMRAEPGNPDEPRRIVTAGVHPPLYVPCLASLAPAEEALWLGRTLVSNTGQSFGVGHVGAYHALALHRIERLWRQAFGLGRPLYDLFSVPYAIVPGELELQSQDPFTVVARDCVALVRSQTVAPFSYVVHHHVRWNPSTPLLPVLARQDVLNRHAAIVEEPFVPRVSTAAHDVSPAKETVRVGGSPCRSRRPAPSVLDLDCDGPGLAVINEAYHPQWRAELDGEPVPIHPLNSAVLGVELPPGRHRLELEYEEPMLGTGLAISLGVWMMFFFVPWKRKRRSVAALGLLSLTLLCGLLSGCQKRLAENNLVLITIDTLRQDRVGLYGGNAGLTPRIDRYFAHGTMAAKAFSPTPCTVPAVKQILTGALVPELTDDRLTDVLRQNGYETAAFLSHYAFGSPESYNLNYARGFEVFDVQTTAELGPDNHSTRAAGTVIGRALAWLRQRDASRPLFLWIHLFDPHDPYAPPGDEWRRLPIVACAEHDSARRGEVRQTIRAIAGNTELGKNTQDTSWMRAAPDMPKKDQWALAALYEREIAYTDAALDELWQYLDESELTQRSLVALTSDHGEQLGEQGAWLHCLSLDDVELEVPLLLRWRGGPLEPSLSRVSFPVSTLDVVPTALARLGITPAHPERLAGRSWLSSSLPPPVVSYWQGAIVVRDDLGKVEWKVGSPEPKDHRLGPALEGIRQLLAAGQSTVPLEQLRALGYVQ